ncbi:hypothetical protein TNCV_1844891 [Trichonephila clavipes]|nr:hypothetical protein TNCV_1844891 [Trichonephila clavipes]
MRHNIFGTPPIKTVCILVQNNKVHFEVLRSKTMPLSEELGRSALAFHTVPLKIIQEVDSFVPGTVWLDRSFGFGDSREEVLEQGAVRANGNQDYQPTSTFFPPPSDASETALKTTPPCYILPTNQETLSHKDPSTDHNQHIRYGIEERFAFHFPVTSSI